MPQPLLDGATAVGAGTPISGAYIAKFSAQAFVVGTGAVSATVIIEGSNNSTPAGAGDWVPIATLNLSGTTRATDGGVAETLWGQIRARVSAISGTNATVSASIQSRGPGYGS